MEAFTGSVGMKARLAYTDAPLYWAYFFEFQIAPNYTYEEYTYVDEGEASQSPGEEQVSNILQNPFLT